jgi:amino acid adenylation domain-containing protein
MALHRYLDEAASPRASHPAVEEPDGEAISYQELAGLSDQVRDRLASLGVSPGDRVGLYVRKSIDAVAWIFGALKAGAGYVPVDPNAPAERGAYIFSNCSVKVVAVERRFAEGLARALAAIGVSPFLVVLDGAGGGRALRARLEQLQRDEPAAIAATVASGPEDLAYILYTSGSTGKPKGVTLTHRNAESFVDWCSEVFAPRPSDRFSSHAPFHFDLSILDIYVPIKHGATVVLIGEELGKEPAPLASFIAERGITVWYSAPSILSLLAQFGNLERHDFSRLRTVLFAGEVFPIVHLRSLTRQLPHPEYYNLYGPTETNVCTFYKVPPQVPEERTEPYPIGKTCSHLCSLVVDAEGGRVAFGAEGELCISGPSVMRGYWNDAAQTERAFLTDGTDTRWYRTGDIVVTDEAGDFKFRGRRDRMIKKRGYRVELGEIEACLYRHPAIREAAVVARTDDTAGMLIRAHVSTRDGSRLSLIQLKQFCSEHVPVYMVPDSFHFHEALPKTSTDKVDYQTLKGME